MSRIEVKHQGKVVGGKIVHYNPELYQQHLYELEGREVVIIVKERHKKPTNSQYGFYRGGILPMCYNSELFSYFENKDAIHSDYFAPKFLGYKTIVRIKNERYEITKVKSLADLNEQEMTIFIEKVLAECSDLEITILSPDEFYNKAYNINHD